MEIVGRRSQREYLKIRWLVRNAYSGGCGCYTIYANLSDIGQS